MRRRAVLALPFAAIALLSPGDAAAEALTPDEQARLAQGEVIRRPLDLDMPDGPAFGGVCYAILDATPSAVMAVLLDPRSYLSILARTVSAKVIGKKGESMLLTLVQGGKWGTATYTLAVRRETPSLLRFWLDPDYLHEIEDCWGYFKLTPIDRGAKTLLTFAALLRLEAGVVRMLFSEKIRAYAFQTPDLLRAYLGRGGP